MAKLTRSLIKKICDTIIKTSGTPRTISSAFGISISSYLGWQRDGEALLLEYDGDLKAARAYLRRRYPRDYRMMLLKGEFALREAQARGECVLAVEQTVYEAAVNDDTGKAGFAFLERRAHKDWAKQVAPAVVIGAGRVISIVEHIQEPRQLEESTPINVEFEDV